MFNKDIKIYGKHAALIKKYTKGNGNDTDVPFVVSGVDGETREVYLFETLIKCFMTCAMLGIVNDRTAPEDKGVDATIFKEAVDKNRNDLDRIYQHMVLTKETDLPIDSRIKKAFSKTNEKDLDEQKKLESYMRGGLEYLDEQFSNCSSYADFAMAIYALDTEISPLSE